LVDQAPYVQGIGAVPRLDRAIDRVFAPTPRFTVPASVAASAKSHNAQKVAQKAADVGANLGLPPEAMQPLTHIVKDLAAAPHELDFRRGLMSHLIEQRFAPSARRMILSQAVNFYRSLRGPRTTKPVAHVLGSAPGSGTGTLLGKSSVRGGKYHRRIPVRRRGKIVGYKYIYSDEAYAKHPDAHVDGASARATHLRVAARRVVDAGGTDGAELEHFHPLVHTHGARDVAAALRDIGASHLGGRIVIAKSQEQEPRLVVPALTKAAGAAENTVTGESKNGVGGPGGMPSPKKLPPGARRIWHNRVMERGADDKWHVVGHVAGLEDPGKTPLLDPSEIDPKHKAELIAKLKALIAQETQKDSASNKPMTAAPALTVPGRPGASSTASAAPKAPTAKPQAQSQPQKRAAAPKLTVGAK